MAQEVERDGGELGACGLAFVVGDGLVHEAPEPLDGVEMRAVWREEVQPDAAARLGQPVLHQPCVVIARIVQIDMPNRHG